MKRPSLNKYIKDQENFKFTRLGLFLFIITLGVMVLGFSQANRGYILLTSMSIIAFVFSYFGVVLSLYFVKVYWIKKECFANQPCEDIITLQNFSPFPVFNLRVYEKSDDLEVCRLIAPLLLPFEKKTYTNLIPYQKRGEHRWNGLYLYSTFPYGLFEKQKKIVHEGRRIIWPEPLLKNKNLTYQLSQADFTGCSKETVVSQEGLPIGSVKNYQSGESASNINWKRSILSQKLLVIEREKDTHSIEFSLNLSKIKTQEALENMISTLTFNILDFHKKNTLAASETLSLKIIENGKMRNLTGMNNIFNFLSLLRRSYEAS